MNFLFNPEEWEGSAMVNNQATCNGAKTGNAKSSVPGTTEEGTESWNRHLYLQYWIVQ